MKKHMRNALAAALMLALIAVTGQVALAETLRWPTANAPVGAMDKAALKSIKMTKTTLKAALASTRDTTADLSKYVKAVPASAELPALSWTSSRPDVVAVDEKGVATYLDVGKAKITAQTPEGKKASITITVSIVRVTSVSSSGTITLSPGETAHVRVTIKPADATFQAVEFGSTDAAIATVDQHGVVTAVAPGTCKINVTTDERGHEKTTATNIQVRTGQGVQLKISAVGDITLGGDPERGTLAQFKKYLDLYEKQYGDRYGTMLKKAAVYFSQDDLTFGNLETCLTKAGGRHEGTYCYKGDPSYAQVLSSSSVEAMNLANNHTTGFGSAGLRSTKSALTKVGVAANGFGYNDAKILMINGLRVGLLGYQTGPRTANANTIKTGVKKMRDKCDVLILSLHFGDTKEYTYKVTNAMKVYAHTAINYGADLVVGHHPHVISGMESYKGKNIVYGLGTFLAGGPNPLRPRRTFIFQETLEVHPGFVESKDAKVIPFWITSSDKTNDRIPQPAPGAEADKIIAHIEKYSVGQKVDYTVVK